MEGFKGSSSFSGCDAVVTIEDKIFGEIQQISWGISREKVGLWTLGSPDVRGFARGKRGIAGSLVVLNFDREAILEHIAYTDTELWKGIAPNNIFSAKANIVSIDSEDFKNAVNLANWRKINNNAVNIAEGNAAGNKILPQGFGTINNKNIRYADQIPPFDIMITYANEYGQAAWQKIYDVELINEATGLNVDTVVLEKTYSFICKAISPLTWGVYLRDSSDNITNKEITYTTSTTV